MPIYLGMGLLGCATIVYEVALTRVFSIAYGYHFAFLAISLGLLGFGLSGTLIALRPKSVKPTGPTLGWLAVAASLTYVGGYLVANNVPLDPYRVGWEPGQLPLLAAYLASYAVPFFLTGLAQGWPITAYPHLSGRLYGSTLAGSGVGGLLALMALNQMSAPQTLASSGILAAMGGFSLTRARSLGEVDVNLASSGDRKAPERRFPGLPSAASIAAAAALMLLAFSGSSWLDVRLSEYKPLSQLLNYPGSRVIHSESNAESRVDAVDSPAVHSAPGLSLQYEGGLPRQTGLVIDGDIVVPLTPVDKVEAGFFDALPSRLAYQLRPGSDVLVLEPGGGLEAAAAVNGQATTVVALHSSRLLADIVSSRLAARSGRIYEHPLVELVATNPRSYLASRSDEFDVITLALSESRRTVTAGAFSLSENYLMTSQAVDAYLEHLRPNGILVIHRWLQLPPTEEVRSAALLVGSLERSGKSARSNVIAIRSFATMLILGKREPFTPEEIAAAKAFVTRRGFDLVYYPGIRPEETNQVNVLRNDRYYDAFQGLMSDPDRFLREHEYEVSAPSDDQPFFFHFFKWEQTPTVLRLLGQTWQPFGGSGYLIVLALLLVTSTLSVVLLVVPALVIRRRERVSGESREWLRPVVYFAMLGLGFLLVEVALVGQLILFLDHSAQAFTLVLFGLLLFSGLGSAQSGRIDWRTALGALAGALAVYALLLPRLIAALLDQPLPVRILATMLLLAPLGTLMGVGFPRGLGWLAGVRPSWVPMAWGVNGFTSVIGAIIAAMISLAQGFSAVLLFGSAAYLIALAAIWTSSTPRPLPGD